MNLEHFDGEVDLSSWEPTGHEKLDQGVRELSEDALRETFEDFPPEARLVVHEGDLKIEVDLPLTASEEQYGFKFRASLQEMIRYDLNSDFNDGIEGASNVEKASFLIEWMRSQADRLEALIKK